MKTAYTVSPEWLKSNLNLENLVILDASLKPVTSQADTREKHNQAIPGARRFDLKQVFSNTDSPYDHTLPSSAHFVEKMRETGVSENSIIVIYDNQGIYSSPRAWYMIKSIGHDDVYVLDGGLPAWIQNNYPTGHPLNSPFIPGNFSNKSAEFSSFCNSDDVLNCLFDSSTDILDARSKGRFEGTDPEPRPGLKSGHIPNSVNLPFDTVLENGKFKRPDELQLIFGPLTERGKMLIFSCGSGITSCITAMAAEISGHKNVRIYDGSWGEWGDEKRNFPIASIE